MMKLYFHGGARTVTGANYLLEVGDEKNKTKILIDCGLLQGSRMAEKKNYENFPLFFPATWAIRPLRFWRQRNLLTALIMWYLKNWISRIKQPKKVFVAQGEEAAEMALQKVVKEELAIDAEAPKIGDIFEL